MLAEGCLMMLVSLNSIHRDFKNNLDDLVQIMLHPLDKNISFSSPTKVKLIAFSIRESHSNDVFLS